MKNKWIKLACPIDLYRSGWDIEELWGCFGPYDKFQLKTEKHRIINAHEKLDKNQEEYIGINYNNCQFLKNTGEKITHYRILKKGKFEILRSRNKELNNAIKHAKKTKKRVQY